jgi:hypothetical protein
VKQRISLVFGGRCGDGCMDGALLTGMNGIWWPSLRLDDAPVGWLVSVCWVAIHAVLVLSDFFFSRTYGALVKFVSTHATYSYTIPTTTETVGLL